MEKTNLQFTFVEKLKARKVIFIKFKENTKYL